MVYVVRAVMDSRWNPGGFREEKKRRQKEEEALSWLLVHSYTEPKLGRA